MASDAQRRWMVPMGASMHQPAIAGVGEHPTPAEWALRRKKTGRKARTRSAAQVLLIGFGAVVLVVLAVAGILAGLRGRLQQ